MPLSPGRFEEAKSWLFEHYDAPRIMPELRDAFPEVSVDDAFRLQFALVERRLAAGETVAGVKAAVTAKVMQQFFGLHEPCPGLLPSGGLVESGAVSVGGWVMANVEPEIAFLLGRPLEGPGVTAGDVTFEIAKRSDLADIKQRLDDLENRDLARRDRERDRG